MGHRVAGDEQPAGTAHIVIPQVFGDACGVVAQVQVIVPRLRRGIRRGAVQVVIRAVIIELAPVARAAKRAGHLDQFRLTADRDLHVPLAMRASDDGL